MRMPASSARSCSSLSRCLQRRWRQRDEALERGAAIGVEADVMVERPLAPGRGGAGEIERAQPVGDERRADDLDHVRVGLLLVARDLDAERRDVDRRVGERREGGARSVAGSIVGRSPCTLTTVSTAPSRVERLQRLEDAVGAGLVVGARHHRLEAVRARPLRRLLGVSVATTTRPSPLSAARARDMDDHRHAGDVGQRLARQPRRGHAGGDQDEVRHGRRGGSGRALPKVAKGLTGSALIGVATTKQKT